MCVPSAWRRPFWTVNKKEGDSCEGIFMCLIYKSDTPIGIFWVHAERRGFLNPEEFLIWKNCRRIQIRNSDQPREEKAGQKRENQRILPRWRKLSLARIEENGAKKGKPENFAPAEEAKPGQDRWKWGKKGENSEFCPGGKSTPRSWVGKSTQGWSRRKECRTKSE